MERKRERENERERKNEKIAKQDHTINIQQFTKSLADFMQQ